MVTSKPRTDSAGTLVERGDIVASFPKSGGMEIARVNNVFPSGRVTGKVADTRNKYAHEEGAPDIEKTGRQYAKNPDGTYKRQIRRNAAGEPVKDWRGHVVEDYVQEDYTYMVKDYTVVGKVHYWTNKQLADLGLLVLVKHDGTKILDLMAEVNRNWDSEVPE